MAKKLRGSGNLTGRWSKPRAAARYVDGMSSRWMSAQNPAWTRRG